MEENICDLGQAKIFLEMTLKAQSTREQIDELGFHQNKKTPALQKTLLRE